MNILVLNCGSSSLKYQVLDMKNEKEYSLLAKGLVERIGLEVGIITHKVPGKENYVVEKEIANHTEGIKDVLELLVDADKGVLKSLGEINAVGHRVAHGGDLFSESAVIHSEVIEGIEKCCELAPLHNPANLLGIKAVRSLMPEIPQVAVFDTSFHQTMPDYAYMYAIPYEYYVVDKVRRYGFHGTSHKFVAKKGAEMFGVDLNNSKIITCHLGNGGSVTAILNGKSVDTSMGFTPVEGVVMGTRCGNIDAGVVTYIQKKYDLDNKGISDVLNKKSGFLGVSGVSSDARDIEGAAAEGNHRAQLALDMFSYACKKYVGAYAAAMNGVDCVVFTAGVGEHTPAVRDKICSNMQYLGMEIDLEKNYQDIRGQIRDITGVNSKVKILIIPTNEELVIARETVELL